MISKKVQFKILLMGPAGAGKTSMKEVIFSSLNPKDTFALQSTLIIATTKMNYIGGNELQILDCGGQLALLPEYFQKENLGMYENVRVLIFVIEAEKFQKNNNGNEDLDYFQRCIDMLDLYSKDAKVFCLINKMDLIRTDRRNFVFEKRRAEILERAKDFDVQCFPTCIWDNSLIYAWNAIISCLFPESDKLKMNLEKLMNACDASEVIVFEKNTLLKICDVCRNMEQSEKRLVNNILILKKLINSFNDSTFAFVSVFFKNPSYSFYIDELTSSSLIMVVSKPDIGKALLEVNINSAKSFFKQSNLF